MFIKDDFSSGAPVSQVPAGWFNSVARFINGLIPGKNVTFYKNDDGSPTVIDVESTLPDGTGVVYVTDGTGSVKSIGTSEGEIAAGDHDHDEDYADIDHDHDEDYAGINHDHDGVYAGINHDHSGVYAVVGHDHSGVYATASHTHSQYALSGHDHSGVYATASHTHAVTSLTATTSSWVRIPVVSKNSTKVTLLSPAAGLLKVNASGGLDSLTVPSGGGLLYTNGTTVSLKEIGTDSGDVAAGDHTHTLSDVTADSAPSSTKILGVASGQTAISLRDGLGNDMVLMSDASTKLSTLFDGNKLKVASIKALTASKWVKTDASGCLTVSGTDPITCPSSAGLLYSNGSSVSVKAFGTAAGTVAEGNHTHTDVYAPAIHDHSGVYATVNHDHSGVYAVAGHNHDANYAAINHNHDTAYAASDHNHDSEYAAANHNHDDDYADVDHEHEVTDITVTAPSSDKIMGVASGATHPDMRDGIGNDMVLMSDGSTKLSTLFDSNDKLNVSAIAALSSTPKWVKTDANGILTVSDDDPVTAVESGCGLEIDSTSKELKICGETSASLYSSFKAWSSCNTSNMATYVPSASLDTAAWTRYSGDTGVTFKVVSRIQRAGVYDVIYWRTLTFDKNGMLRDVSAEQGSAVVVNVMGYSGV